MGASHKACFEALWEKEKPRSGEFSPLLAKTISEGSFDAVAGVKGGSGGARAGAGRKKKPLAEKVLEGNPGKRPLTVAAFKDAPALEAADVPAPREFLKAVQKDGKRTKAEEIYAETWAWLSARRCAHLIPAQVIEQYAQSAARWIQAEEAVTAFGFLAKHPTTGAAMASPYVKMSQDFMRQTNNLWLQISQTVQENCAAAYSGAAPQDDVMERLLTARRGE
jgi:hypothetical protein